MKVYFVDFENIKIINYIVDDTTKIPIKIDNIWYFEYFKTYKEAYNKLGKYMDLLLDDISYLKKELNKKIKIYVKKAKLFKLIPEEEIKFFDLKDFYRKVSNYTVNSRIYPKFAFIGKNEQKTFVNLLGECPIKLENIIIIKVEEETFLEFGGINKIC